MRFTIPFTKKPLPFSPARERGYTHVRWIFDNDWLVYTNLIRFSLEPEVLKDGNWVPSHGYYGARLSSEFKLGSEHDWYDGPHCQFSLGFLHLNWMPDYCKKCCNCA